MQIRLVNEINNYEGRRIRTANGVAVTDTCLYAISGEYSEVYCYDINSHECIRKVGGWGIGHDKLMVPVAIAHNKGTVYVADWYNHRVLCLDTKLEFVDTFGTYGDIEKKVMSKRIRRFLTRNALISSYDRYNKYIRKVVQLSVLARRTPHRLIQKCMNSNLWFNKPDGFAFVGDTIFVSQHYNHCVSAINRKRKTVHYYGEKGDGPGQFKRPANMLYSPHTDEIYVADIFNARISVFSSDMQFKCSMKGQKSNHMGAFFPFGLALLNETLLVVCGAEMIQVFDLERKSQVFACAGPYNQLHGLAYSDTQKKLYAADRLNHRVCVFDVVF